MQLQELGSILEEKTNAITKKIKKTVLLFLTRPTYLRHSRKIFRSCVLKAASSECSYMFYVATLHTPLRDDTSKTEHCKV